MAIHALPDHIINQIAAGEVIERPASVVKELVENALDAGAAEIEIVTAGGGKGLIRVRDDGRGMSHADLETAVLRHHTSKLPGNDLKAIETLGFRGEALAAIGSVARLIVSSRLNGSDDAWSVSVENGKADPARPAALERGTVIEVSDLFFSTPARLKFLRSDRAESNAITDICRRLVLVAPTVGFTLTGEDRSLMRFRPATDASDRVHDVMGSQFAQSAIEIDAERGGVGIRGLVGLPTFSRANSLRQYFSVNDRPVRDRQLTGALNAAYADVMKRGRYPVAALGLSCDPAQVDINVHPAKAEIRFRDAGNVRALVIGSIREALSEAGIAPSRAATERTLSAFHGAAPTDKHANVQSASWKGWSAPAPLAGANGGFAEAEQAGLRVPQAGQTHLPIDQPPAAAVSTPPEAGPPDAADEFPLGAAMAHLHKNYIVTQSRDGLVIVDQHAAHERIVYERLKSAMAGEPVPRQILLIPEVVELDADDAGRLAERGAELAELGLILEPFGHGAILVTETPSLLGQIDIKAMVSAIADDLAEWDASSRLVEHLNQVAATMACYGSVRSGRILNTQEMNALLRDMEATPNAGQCNHGRPTFVELKLSDIERLFGRR